MVGDQARTLVSLWFGFPARGTQIFLFFHRLFQASRWLNVVGAPHHIFFVQKRYFFKKWTKTVATKTRIACEVIFLSEKKKKDARALWRWPAPQQQGTLKAQIHRNLQYRAARARREPQGTVSRGTINLF